MSMRSKEALAALRALDEQRSHTAPAVAPDIMSGTHLPSLKNKNGPEEVELRRRALRLYGKEVLVRTVEGSIFEGKLLGMKDGVRGSGLRLAVGGEDTTEQFVPSSIVVSIELKKASEARVAVTDGKKLGGVAAKRAAEPKKNEPESKG